MMPEYNMLSEIETDTPAPFKWNEVFRVVPKEFGTAGDWVTAI